MCVCVYIYIYIYTQNLTKALLPCMYIGNFRFQHSLLYSLCCSFVCLSTDRLIQGKQLLLNPPMLLHKATND
ncbi:unnamed protein product [Coffea canephora]|uniref:Uncharacterized protein n=1 Tax=Coffea canephora TaxID=49390 RepID=A0A068UY30_COFCA|nr:unnamed protein product [Coffea canephora]